MNIQFPKAILFDLDNTILANDLSAPKHWGKAFARFSSRLGGSDAQELLAAMTDIRRQYMADPEWDAWARLNLTASRRALVVLAFSRLGIDADELADEIVDAYREIREESREILPGAVDALKRIREMGKGMALISNGLSSSQRGKIERAGLEPLFDSIIIEEEFGVGKPDPSIFRHALEQLAAQPHEAVMVGDNLHADIAGAQALGIGTVWVDWEGKGLSKDSPTTPDSTVRSITELIASHDGTISQSGWEGRCGNRCR